MESIEFSEKLDMECERKRGVKNDAKGNAVNIDYGGEFAFRHLVLKYLLELVGS